MMATPHEGLSFPDLLQEGDVSIENLPAKELLRRSKRRSAKSLSKRRSSSSKSKSSRRSDRGPVDPPESPRLSRRNKTHGHQLESPKTPHQGYHRSHSRSSTDRSPNVYANKPHSLAESPITPRGQDPYKSPKTPDTANTANTSMSATSAANSGRTSSSHINSSCNDGRDEDDDLLDELLDQSAGGISRRRSRSRRKANNKTNDFSKSPESQSGGNGGDMTDFVFDTSYEKIQDDEDSSISDDDSVATKDLLERANERLLNQQLMEEIKGLKEIIVKKDNEIEQMSGQLRMAVATKCDLIIAHTELERHHEVDLKLKEQTVKEMKSTNHSLLEMRAEIEKEFMNELLSLSIEIAELKEKHKKQTKAKNKQLQQIQDEIIEKDYRISQLEDIIRRSDTKRNTETSNDKGYSARPDSAQKARKYRKN